MVQEESGPTTFEDFFHAEKDRLLRVMRVITGSRAEAEDITQEAFLRLFERWETVAKMDNPEGYLHRVAMNQFRSRYRRAAVGLRRAVATVRLEMSSPRSTTAISHCGSSDRCPLASARRWCSPRRSAIRARRRGGCSASRRRRYGPSRIRRARPSQRWRIRMADPGASSSAVSPARSESYTLESFYRRRDRKRARSGSLQGSSDSRSRSRSSSSARRHSGRPPKTSPWAGRDHRSFVKVRCSSSRTTA